MKTSTIPLLIVIVLLIAVALMGCASNKPPVIITEHKPSPVIVPAACQATVKRPDMPDPTEVLKTAPDDRFVQLLGAGRLMRDPYIRQLEAGFTGCGGRIE